MTDGKTTTAYVYKPYPKYLRNADGRCCVVQDIEAHRALGEGWPRPEGDEPIQAVWYNPGAPTTLPIVADEAPAPPVRRRRKPKA